jgi:WD40 repeat protein
MVTSADSKIKILDGTIVTQKYSGKLKCFTPLGLPSYLFRCITNSYSHISIQSGLRSGSCQSSATFTADGQHIISASEDSNIYVWNHESQDEFSCKHAKSLRSSERFHSINAAIAIPWNGNGPRSPVSLASQILPQGDNNFLCMTEAAKVNSSGPSIFNLNLELSPKSNCRSSATWPEEILPSCSVLRNCLQSTSNSWGQVIVTAGWDGRIRSFQNYGLPIHQWLVWAFGGSVRHHWYLTWPED